MSRGDRLDGFIRQPPGGGGPSTPQSPTASAQAPTLVRKRALLYAPPPAPAGAYVQILRVEGYDTFVAQDPQTADALLRQASPSLILAVAPVLGADLRDQWRALAPEAEIRVIPGLVPLVEERVVPQTELLDYTVRLASALSGLLAVVRGGTKERAQRVAVVAEQAAGVLEMGFADRTRVRLLAALFPVPAVLESADASPTKAQTVKDDLAHHRQLMASFLDSIATPLPLAGRAGPVAPPAERRPTAEEVVEAAIDIVVLLDRGDSSAAVTLRAHAAEGKLHPSAVEAVLVAAGVAKRGQRGTVLLADPDGATRNILALRLASEGYLVRTVTTGPLALEEIRKSPPSVVLAEMLLPGMDGYQLLDTLKREGHKVPFVLLSSREDPSYATKALLLGAADYITKPVNMDLFLTKLQRLVGQQFDATDVSARIGLSHFAAPSSFAVVTYEELAAGVELMGRFRIESDLGEGGMGKVFKASDEKLEEVVVVKVMKPLLDDPKLLEHFKREIRLARKITHPGVVRIFDFWEAVPLYFVTMEWLEGKDLRSEVKRRGPFPVPVAVRIGIELFEALAAAHEVGVVHRDIKPHNVVMLPTGRIKILDFGIAQALDQGTGESATATTGVVGTPEYMSPEQILGDRVDARTDLYSSGALIYELLTGDIPLRGENRMATATMHLNTQPAPPSSKRPEVPAALDAFVMRLLEKNREERFASAQEAAQQLRALLG